MNYELRQYSFGETIGKGFNLFFNNFVALVLAALICQLPVIVLAEVFGLTTLGQSPIVESGVPWGVLGGSITVAFVNIVSMAALSAFVYHVVSRKVLGGEAPGGGNALIPIMAKVFPIILLSFLVGIYTVLWGFLFIIPGIVASLRYSMATAVLVVENTGVKEAIGRSKELTEGRKGRIFGWIFITSLIIACINQPFSGLAVMVTKDIRILTVAGYLVGACTAPIYSCILAVIYFNLRIEKEGFNIEHLTEQFSLAEEPPQTLEG